MHLDGLPLAIELAAARTQLLSPQMMLERLEQRLSLLHWEAQDLPTRQHTLRAAIAWSYDLLAHDEQVLFRHLGIFVGGFTLEAAEAIVSDAPHQAIDVLEGLASLVDKSLVLSEEDGEGGRRFRLLESVREYALEQVTSSDEGEAVGRACPVFPGPGRASRARARWAHAARVVSAARAGARESAGRPPVAVGPRRKRAGPAAGSSAGLLLGGTRLPQRGTEGAGGGVSTRARCRSPAAG